MGADLRGVLLDVVNQVRGLSTSKPDKYEVVKHVFAKELEVEVAVCYLSDLPKMFTPRVGQALIGRPSALILLASDPYAQAYLDRLEQLVAWIGRIEFVLACTGWEGNWTVDHVIGPEDSMLAGLMERTFDGATCVRVTVPALARAPLPGED